MSALQFYNTRTRAKQTFVPADSSGRVGLFVCGPAAYELPHLGHAKTRRASGLGSTRPRSRACTSARIWTTCGRCATTPWTCTRAPATTSTKSSARSSACGRRARRHQGAQLDAQLVEVIHCWAIRRGPACRCRAAAARVGLVHDGLTDQAGLRCVHAKTVPQAARDRVREALAADSGDPSLGRPVPSADTTSVGAHP
jgi:hypothetical protein